MGVRLTRLRLRRFGRQVLTGLVIGLMAIPLLVACALGALGEWLAPFHNDGLDRRNPW